MLVAGLTPSFFIFPFKCRRVTFGNRLRLAKGLSWLVFPFGDIPASPICCLQGKPLPLQLFIPVLFAFYGGIGLFFPWISSVGLLSARLNDLLTKGRSAPRFWLSSLLKDGFTHSSLGPIQCLLFPMLDLCAWRLRTVS